MNPFPVQENSSNDFFKEVLVKVNLGLEFFGLEVSLENVRKDPKISFEIKI